MGKIIKKINKIQLKTKQIKRNEKKHNNLKECFVNLEKMTEHDYEIYSKSDIIKTASFHLKISGNQLEIADHGNGSQTQQSEARIFNITLNRRFNMFMLENSLVTVGMYSKFTLNFKVNIFVTYPFK